MCTLADQFKEFRQVNIVSLVSSSSKETQFKQKNAGAGKDQRNLKVQTSKNEGQQSARQNRTGSGRDGRRCYKCSRPGQIASQCYQSSNRNRSMAVTGAKPNETVSGFRSHGDSGKGAALTSITSTVTFSVANDFDLITTTVCSVTNFSDQMSSYAGELSS